MIYLFQLLLLEIVHNLNLIEFFEYNAQTAIEITESIHNTGAATVAVLPYEIAEQKGVEVTLSARQQNYPLQVKLEPAVA